LYALDGGVMYATVKADDNKPLAAGKVREFKKDDVEQLIEYTPADVYVVSDAESLKKVADEENLSATVVMVADVDMSGVTAWTSIENFAGEFYGNGYAIKGLTAPLFSTTTASVIKGVHLEDVDIDYTDSNKPNFGALVGKIDNTDAEISHCSVTGDIEINMTDAAADLYIAGVIGYSTSQKEFSYLTNEANVTVKGSFEVAVYLSGCIGYHNTSSVSNIINLGTINYAGESCTKTLSISGVVGNCKTFKNVYNGCDNPENPRGTIICSGSSSGSFRMGGIISTPTAISHSTPASFTDCINYGTVKIANTAICGGSVFIGGLAGLVQYKNLTYTRCANKGLVCVENEAEVPAVYIGGLTSRLMRSGSNGSLTIEEGFTNSGDISVATAIGAGNIAGVIGATHGQSNITDSSTGVIKNTGAISYTGTSTATINVAGIVNLAGNALPDLDKATLRYENRGSITVTGTGSTIYVGGCMNGNYVIRNASCYCTIAAGNVTNVGMITGRAYNADAPLTGCKVGGTIYRTETQDGDTGAVETTLGEGNFYNYIYGSGNSEANANGCEYWNGK